MSLVFLLAPLKTTKQRSTNSNNDAPFLGCCRSDSRSPSKKFSFCWFKEGMRGVQKVCLQIQPNSSRVLGRPFLKSTAVGPFRPGPFRGAGHRGVAVFQCQAGRGGLLRQLRLRVDLAPTPKLRWIHRQEIVLGPPNMLIHLWRCVLS